MWFRGVTRAGPRPDGRTAGPASRSSATSSPTRCGSRTARLRDHELRRPARRPDVPDGRTSAGDFCPPSLYPSARRQVPDHAWPGARRAAVREPVGDADDQRGVTLKEFLETAVSPPPTTGNGRFGQVSGLCCRVQHRGPPAKQFDATGTASRVREPRHSSRAAGSRRTCDFTLGVPVALDAGHSYTVTINDFMMTGGDGYPNVRTSAATQDLLDQDVADYLATLPGSQVTPTIQHRVHCFDPNPGSGNNCPVELAVDERARGPAASCGGLPLPAPPPRGASCRARPASSQAARPVVRSRPAPSARSRGSRRRRSLPVRTGRDPPAEDPVDLVRRLPGRSAAALDRSSGSGGRARRSSRRLAATLRQRGAAFGSADAGTFAFAGSRSRLR